MNFLAKEKVSKVFNFLVVTFVSISIATSANAYPIFAQQNYANLVKQQVVLFVQTVI
jgi:hypothetical protein